MQSPWTQTIVDEGLGRRGTGMKGSVGEKKRDIYNTLNNKDKFNNKKRNIRLWSWATSARLHLPSFLHMPKGLKNRYLIYIQAAFTVLEELSEEIKWSHCSEAATLRKSSSWRKGERLCQCLHIPETSDNPLITPLRDSGKNGHRSRPGVITGVSSCFNPEAKDAGLILLKNTI